MYQIKQVYLKECQLRQPNSPQILSEDGAPQVDVQLEIDAQSVSPETPEIVEVVISAVVTATLRERVLYEASMQQAGIFALDPSHPSLSTVLSQDCPHALFPYLRANLADLIVRAGFPPLHLQRVEFGAPKPN